MAQAIPQTGSSLPLRILWFISILNLLLIYPKSDDWEPLELVRGSFNPETCMSITQSSFLYPVCYDNFYTIIFIKAWDTVYTFF